MVLKAQYYLLASSVGVASAILKLSLIILPFGAYSTTQSTFGGVRQQCVMMYVPFGVFEVNSVSK